MTSNTRTRPRPVDNDHDDDNLYNFPQRDHEFEFPNHPVSPDGFIKSRQVADQRGRSTTLSFKCTPEEARILEECAVDYRDLGYKTVSDVVRHAVRDHIARLTDKSYREKRSGNVDNAWPQLKLMLDHIHKEELASKFDEAMSQTEEHIRRCRRVGADSEIRNQLRTLRQAIRNVTNPFWRSFWEREVSSRWGEYLDN